MCFATTTIPVRNFLSTLKLLKRPLEWLDFQDGNKIPTKKHYHWVLQPMKISQNWRTGIFDSNSVQIIDSRLASLPNICTHAYLQKLEKQDHVLEWSVSLPFS